MLRNKSFRVPVAIVRQVHSGLQKKKPFRVIQDKLDKSCPTVVEGQKRYEENNKNYQALHQKCMQGGGEKAIKRHTQLNKKMLPRNRLNALLDPGSSFLEIGFFAGLDMLYGDIAAAGSIAGIGQIHGVHCAISINDATVKGGTFFPISVRKTVRMQEIALTNYLPCIHLIDSGGAFLPLQADIFPDKNHGGKTFFNHAVMSAMGIPQVTLVCGSCTAGAAYTPTMSDETVIVDRIGTIFLAGPPLVKAATGEVVSSEDLGGARMHCNVSGCTDHFAANEEDALERCRDIVASFNIPAEEWSEEVDNPLHSPEDLSALSGMLELSSQHVYAFLSCILDGSRFQEFKQLFGENLCTGFGFLDGLLVGILVNRGPLSSNDALKGCHFVQLCDQRDVPLIFCQASTGKEDQTSGNVLKDRGKMAAAVATCHVPKISLNMIGCHSDDNITMCGPGFLPNLNLSWPLAAFSNLHMSSSSDGELLPPVDVPLSDFSEHSAMFSGSQMLTDAIILPKDTRSVLQKTLRMVMQGRDAKERRHSVLRM